MLDTQLFQFLKLLSKDELKTFKLWLKSAHHKGGNQLIYANQLMDAMSIYFPFQEDNNALDKTKIMQMANIEEKDFNKTLHFTNELLKEFIAYTALKNDENQQLFYLNEYCTKKGEKDIVKQLIQKIDKNIAQIEHKDVKDFEKAYLLETEKVYYNSYHDNQNGDLNIQNTLYHLDVYYLASKLSHYCFLLFQNYRNSFTIHYNNTNDIENLIYNGTSEYFEIPLIKMFSYLFLMFQHKNEQVTPEQENAFVKLNICLKKHENEVPKERLKEFAAYIRSFYVVNYVNKSTDIAFVHKIFDIYKEHSENGYLDYNDKIYFSTFKNFIVYGSRTQRLNEVEEFIRQYRNNIIISSKGNNIWNYYEAEIAFIKGKYKEVLAQLENCTFNENKVADLDKYRLLIRANYEIDASSEILYNAIENHRNQTYRFKKEAKISDLYFKYNRNFHEKIKILVHLNPYDKKIIQKEISAIEQNIDLPDKKWFLEKLRKI
jgi:hypothetical protein